MAMDTRAALRQGFADVLVMYDLMPVLYAHDLVEAACVLLGTSLETGSVLALASLPPSKMRNAFVMDDVVKMARADLGMPLLSHDETQVRAAQTMARRWQVGLVTDRELTGWAHSVLTHGGADAVQDLVMHDDLIDVPCYGLDEETAHEALIAIVETLLSLPDPWSLLQYSCTPSE